MHRVIWAVGLAVAVLALSCGIKAPPRPPSMTAPVDAGTPSR